MTRVSIHAVSIHEVSIHEVSERVPGILMRLGGTESVPHHLPLIKVEDARLKRLKTTRSRIENHRGPKRS